MTSLQFMMRYLILVVNFFPSGLFFAERHDEKVDISKVIAMGATKSSIVFYRSLFLPGFFSSKLPGWLHIILDTVFKPQRSRRSPTNLPIIKSETSVHKTCTYIFYVYFFGHLDAEEWKISAIGADTYWLVVYSVVVKMTIRRSNKNCPKIGDGFSRSSALTLFSEASLIFVINSKYLFFFFALNLYHIFQS